MKHAEKIAPIAAAVSALATLACCLPIAFAAGTAMAGLAVVAGSYRWWFLGASAGLLLVGGVQLVRVRRTCATRRAGSMVILGVSAAIVLLVLAFPQVVAGLIADWMP
jgi:predicted small integral membrane protein